MQSDSRVSGNPIFVIMGAAIILLEPIIKGIPTSSEPTKIIKIISFVDRDGIEMKCIKYCDNKKEVKGSIFIDRFNISDIILKSFLFSNKNNYKIVLICKKPIFLKNSKRYKKEILLFSETLMSEDNRLIYEEGFKDIIKKFKDILKLE